MKTGIIALLMIASPLFSGAGNSDRTMVHSFPDLGYSYQALEPVVDAQTMELHYSKHFRGYYDKFVEAAKPLGLLETPMEQIFAQITKYPEVIRNNGGGYYNHVLFFENMTPQQNEVPDVLKNAIEKDFGSWNTFVTTFETAAKSRFGSGWAWLCIGADGKLFVTSTANQDNPLMGIADKQGKPLLALDVWEHAYYLKYQNRRPEYITNFWKVVNWQVVSDRYKNALK